MANLPESGVIVKLQSVQANKRLFASLVISACILLIYMGGTVFHIAPQFSFQPHHPRALVEAKTTKRLNQNATTNSVIAADLDKNVPKLSDQNAPRPPFYCAVFQLDSATISSIGARAPPALTA